MVLWENLALIMLFAIILCKSVYADDLLHYFDTSGIEASVEKNSNINFSELFNNIISGNASEVKIVLLIILKNYF